MEETCKDSLSQSNLLSIFDSIHLLATDVGSCCHSSAGASDKKGIVRSKLGLATFAIQLVEAAVVYARLVLQITMRHGLS